MEHASEAFPAQVEYVKGWGKLTGAEEVEVHIVGGWH